MSNTVPTQSNQLIPAFFSGLVDRNLMPTAFKVAIAVGSLLFVINHGAACLQGEMTRSRWMAGALTYLVPYLVNIHGQVISRVRREA